MTTAAEQYRALVAKLEAINPDTSVNEAGYMATPVANTEPVAADPNASPDQSAMNVASDNVPQPAPAADPNQIPTIEASTFSQAYAKAKQQGLKTFKWCGTYAVKDKPAPVNPQPAPTKQDQMTFANAYSLRNAPNQPLLKPSDVTQAGPNSTILKPGGGVDINKLMTQKAAPRK